jgi:LuxR family maltose regulon positive regulatory protein
MAGLRRAEGDLDGAVALLDEAQRVYTGDYSPNVRPVPALRACLDVARGALSDALHWARHCGVTPDDDLSYLREFEHLTLARVLLADERVPVDDVLTFLGRLRAAAEQGHRTRSVIEISIVEARALQDSGNGAGALACLRRTLELAQAEDYVRTFVDEGRVVAAMLKQVAREGVASSYARRLLSAGMRKQSTSRMGQPLIDPLSDRELDVLRLLATELSGPEIARELVVSLSTVRTHTKNIYAKLGVNNRRAAVRQGAELHLLSKTSQR